MKGLFVITALIGYTSLFAQGDATVLTVDGKNVTVGEFEAIYKKNNKDADVTKEALDEYMELFINYKLKVREAEALGMDTISKFQRELAGYRRQLARPYLIDRELNESLLKEAYERRGQEVRASHILVSIEGDKNPQDTLEAWNKILELRKRVTTGGEDFASVAKGPGGSADPSAKNNGGDLGYFTALQMVYPFENVAFKTPVGEVSSPIRTRFGYHILKVVDKRPARGEIKTAHIMVRSVGEDTEAKKADAKKRIFEVHDLLKKGDDTFANFALKYSEDQGSSSKGGELPKFSSGKMVEAFENAAFELKEDGDFSEPFMTQYGWHIVKRISYDPIGSFDDMKGQLKSKISKDSRAEITKKSFIQRLKKEYAYTAYPKNASKLVKKGWITPEVFTKGTAVNDTTTRANARLGMVTVAGKNYERSLNGVFKDGKFVNIRSRQYSELAEIASDTVVVRQIAKGWKLDPVKSAKLTKPMFSLNGKNYTQKDFLSYIEKTQRNGATPNGNWQQAYADEKFATWVDEEVINYEDSRLEEKYPEFRMLMKEYRDGILLFELTDEKVWGKAVSDSAGLVAFHESRMNDFKWPKRWNATLYRCGSDKIAGLTRKLLKRGKSASEAQAVVNEKSSLDLTIESDLFDAEQRPFLDQINELGLSDNMKVDGQVVFADVKEIIEAEPKKLDEARGLITAAYQDHLEKKWIEELRSKYSFKVNEQVLYNIK